MRARARTSWALAPRSGLGAAAFRTRRAAPPRALRVAATVGVCTRVLCVKSKLCSVPGSVKGVSDAGSVDLCGRPSV